MLTHLFSHKLHDIKQGMVQAEAKRAQHPLPLGRYFNPVPTEVDLNVLFRIKQDEYRQGSRRLQSEFYDGKDALAAQKQVKSAHESLAQVAVALYKTSRSLEEFRKTMRNLLKDMSESRTEGSSLNIVQADFYMPTPKEAIEQTIENLRLASEFAV